MLGAADGEIVSSKSHVLLTVMLLVSVAAD